jgi:hypothetical protein
MLTHRDLKLGPVLKNLLSRDADLESSSAGEHAIKGKAERQSVYRLDSIKEGATRFDAAVGRGLTTYVGRTKELEVLERYFNEARSNVRVVDIAGEAGIGQSRSASSEFGPKGCVSRLM